MDIVRQIDVYDTQTERRVRELSLESFELDLFKRRFEVHPEDPLMYKVYQITLNTMDLFAGIEFDFEKHSYYVACYQT